MNHRFFACLFFAHIQECAISQRHAQLKSPQEKIFQKSRRKTAGGNRFCWPHSPGRSPLGLLLRLAAHADDGDAGRREDKHGKNRADNGHAGLGEVLAVAVPVRPGWIRP